MKNLRCGRLACWALSALGAVTGLGGVCSRRAEATGGAVTVTVLDDATGHPIANARVTVGESADANANGVHTVLATRTTGATGDVTFGGLSLHTQYTLVVSKAGLASAFRVVSLAPSDEVIPGFAVVAVRFLLHAN